MFRRALNDTESAHAVLKSVIADQCNAIYHSNCHRLCQSNKTRMKTMMRTQSSIHFVAASSVFAATTRHNRQQHKQIRPVDRVLTRTTRADAKESNKRERESSTKKNALFLSFNAIVCRCEADEFSVHWKTWKYSNVKCRLKCNCKSHGDILPFSFLIYIRKNPLHIDLNWVGEQFEIMSFCFNLNSAIRLTCLSVIPQNSANNNENVDAIDSRDMFRPQSEVRTVNRHIAFNVYVFIVLSQ